MANLDLDLKKAFTEMQVNTIKTTKNIKMIDMKCDMLKSAKHKYELTEIVTGELTPETPVYLMVGRMFVLSDVDKVRNDLKEKKDKCDKTLEVLTKKKEFMSQQLKEQEEGLRETVQKKKLTDANLNELSKNVDILF